MRLSHEDFERQKPANSVRVAEALDGLPIHIQRDWLTEEQSWREIEKRAGSYYWERISGCIPNSVGDTESIYRYKENSVVSGCFGTRHSPSLEARYKQLEQGQKDRISKSVRLKLDGFCPTLRAGTASDRGSFQAVRPIHPTLPRVITPREAARLQGFPDWYRFAPSKWHSFRQIGNSVSPILAEIVFKVIYSHIAVMEAHNV